MAIITIRDIPPLEPEWHLQLLVLGPHHTVERSSGLGALYRALRSGTQEPHRGGGNISCLQLRRSAIEGGSWVNIIAQHHPSSNEQSYVGDGLL
jgi:hypothetical protein